MDLPDLLDHREQKSGVSPNNSIPFAAGLEMVVACPGNHRITLGADKAYDVAEFVADLRDYNVTPHVAQNTTDRRSAIDCGKFCPEAVWTPMLPVFCHAPGRYCSWLGHDRQHLGSRIRL
jgi:hypothetical protein